MTDLRRLTAAHMAFIAQLREMFPGEDDASLQDTIDGASDLKEAIIGTLRAAQEADALADGLVQLQAKLAERKERLKARAERLRLAALQAAMEADYKSIVAPDFSASVVAGKPKVFIPDADAVPDTFCRFTKTPNKSAIGDALSAGLKPSWASWTNAVPYWSVRTR